MERFFVTKIYLKASVHELIQIQSAALTTSLFPVVLSAISSTAGSYSRSTVFSPLRTFQFFSKPSPSEAYFWHPRILPTTSCTYQPLEANLIADLFGFIWIPRKIRCSRPTGTIVFRGSSSRPVHSKFWLYVCRIIFAQGQTSPRPV